MKEAARGNDHATAAREKQKKFLNTVERLPRGSSLLVTLLVFEHFGRWNVKADNLLNDLADKCKDPYLNGALS